MEKSILGVSKGITLGKRGKALAHLRHNTREQVRKGTIAGVGKGYNDKGSPYDVNPYLEKFNQNGLINEKGEWIQIKDKKEYFEGANERRKENRKEIIKAQKEGILKGDMELMEIELSMSSEMFEKAGVIIKNKEAVEAAKEEGVSTKVIPLEKINKKKLSEYVKAAQDGVDKELVERYGSENLISFNLHMDENGGPHIHVLYSPKKGDIDKRYKNEENYLYTKTGNKRLFRNITEKELQEYGGEEIEEEGKKKGRHIETGVVKTGTFVKHPLKMETIKKTLTQGITDGTKDTYLDQEGKEYKGYSAKQQHGQDTLNGISGVKEHGGVNRNIKKDMKGAGGEVRKESGSEWRAEQKRAVNGYNNFKEKFQDEVMDNLKTRAEREFSKNEKDIIGMKARINHYQKLGVDIKEGKEKFKDFESELREKDSKEFDKGFKKEESLKLTVEEVKGILDKHGIKIYDIKPEDFFDMRSWSAQAVEEQAKEGKEQQERVKEAERQMERRSR